MNDSKSDDSESVSQCRVALVQAQDLVDRQPLPLGLLSLLCIIFRHQEKWGNSSGLHTKRIKECARRN